MYRHASEDLILEKLESKRGRKFSLFELYETKFYKAWCGLKERCSNPNVDSYKSHGARGIKVCEKWLKFWNFYDDMYLTYLLTSAEENKLSLDRINNDGDYCKENCRWATAKEQARNRRTSRFITIDDQTKTLAQWCEEKGIKHSLVTTRMREMGWSIEKAILEPIGKPGRKFGWSKKS